MPEAPPKDTNTDPDDESLPPRPAAERSIVLVGLMGAGKSSIGRRLAQRLNLPFVDADTEIEKAAGCSISDIFKLYGEAEFRRGERQVIHRLLSGPRQVIATGGGAFMDEETRADIRANALSIWLKADLDTLVKRTRRRRHARPLLAEREPRAVLAELIERRYPVYGEADLTVESADVPHDVTVERVIDLIEGRSRDQGCERGNGEGDSA